ncbi:hypothetical protein DOO78_12295 [Roseicella frigidaeris]|uniref:Surface antigen domain-containing protein n=1 Tax=Roseicella frigidaeris TaxID=2230885 RepID=A0A327MFE6_9PROT|nr:hypothetical protein DOO78_12295 [Roseicella frigidaeris]
MRRPALRLPALLLATALLGGCSSFGDLLGAATGTAAAAGSGNPALGVAIGVSTNAVANWGWRRLTRRWHTSEQEAIALAAGEAPIGEARPWQVRHTLPIGNEQGEVRVLRVIETPLATCREILFSVEDGEGAGLTRRWYVTSLCRQETGWRWAAAEPATERWGSLQ